VDALARLEPVRCKSFAGFKFAVAVDQSAPRSLGASRVVLLRFRCNWGNDRRIILERALVGLAAHLGVPGGAAALQGGLEVACEFNVAGLAWLCCRALLSELGNSRKVLHGASCGV
jgi:hypothetical protein